MSEESGGRRQVKERRAEEASEVYKSKEDGLDEVAGSKFRFANLSANGRGLAVAAGTGEHSLLVL